MENTPVNINNEDINEIVNQLFGENIANESDNPEDVESIEEESEKPEVQTVSLRKFTDTNDFASRFSGAEWFDSMKHSSVVLAGCGGIGSWASILLSRLNIYTLYIIDPDIVEEANMAGQFFTIYDIGKNKVETLSDNVRKLSPNTIIISRKERISERNILSAYKYYDTSIFVCGFDNMKARKDMFRYFTSIVNESAEPQKFLFIDGRLTADTFQIYCVRGDDYVGKEKYINSGLNFTDIEADQLPCSFKQTTYLAAMIGSFITNYVVNFVGSFGEGAKSIFYNVPFFTEYNAVLNLLKTSND